MANNLLATIVCNITNTEYSAGDQIDIYWDDVANDFYVEENSSQITSGGVILNQEIQDTTYSITGVNRPNLSGGSGNVLYFSSYSFCDVLDLSEFVIVESFPYASRVITANSPVCTAVVCDLEFVGNAQTTLATGQDQSDGEITITAFSSNEVRFSLSQLDFGAITNVSSVSGDNYSYTFTGLLPGSYTVYAIDSVGCTRSRTVYVSFSGLSSYGIYRWFEFNDHWDVTWRVDILKRDFSGSSTEITKLAVNPLTLRFNGDNNGVLQGKIPSQITLGLKNETDGEFFDLFTLNEREYLVKAYRDSVLIQQGYITTELYSEPWSPPPYNTTIIATDRLADLDSFEFLEEAPDSSNPGQTIKQRVRGDISVIDALLICVNKLGLDQPIRSCFNIYETNHDSTSSDDPLAQTYINADSYYDEEGNPKNCNEVLEDICKSLNCRFYSAGGYWYIFRIPEQKDSSVAYRQFDASGNYVSNGTISPILEVVTDFASSGGRFLNQNNLRSIEKVYGTINVIKDRYLLGNLFPAINETNLDGDEYPGWGYVLNSDLGYVFPKQKKDQYYLRVQTAPFIGGQALNHSADLYIVTSGSVEYKGIDTFEIKVDFEIPPLVNGVLGSGTTVAPPYYRLKWLFKVGSKYLTSDGSWSSTETDNTYFASPSDTSFTIASTFDPSVLSDTSSTYEFRLYGICLYESDVQESSVTNMGNSIDDISTTGLDLGTRIIGNVSGIGNYNLYYYELQNGTNITETRPGEITPDDNSNLVWILKDTRTYSSNFGDLLTVNLDVNSIEFNFFPNGEELPEDQIVSKSLSEGNLKTLDYEVFHFDTDTSINNTQNMIANYFRLSDGTPTSQWGINNKSIEEILADSLTQLIFPTGSEGKRGAFRLNGNFRFNTAIMNYNVIRNSNDDNRIFIMNSYEFHAKSAEISNGEIVELGSDTETLTKAFQDNAFSSGFK
ncbi:MAG: hypothetical protein NXI20_17860 [bacterium]|nr:hypothetical protein [bacterium]